MTTAPENQGFSMASGRRQGPSTVKCSRVLIAIFKRICLTRLEVASKR